MRNRINAFTHLRIYASSPWSLRSLRLIICSTIVEYPLQIGPSLFKTKPICRRCEIRISSVLTRDCEENPCFASQSKQSQTNPISNQTRSCRCFRHMNDSVCYCGLARATNFNPARIWRFYQNGGHGGSNRGGAADLGTWRNCSTDFDCKMPRTGLQMQNSLTTDELRLKATSQALFILQTEERF